jgi:hypothetical protein
LGSELDDDEEHLDDETPNRILCQYEKVSIQCISMYEMIINNYKYCTNIISNDIGDAHKEQVEKRSQRWRHQCEWA